MRMSQEDLIAIAVEQLRKTQGALERVEKIPPEIQRLKVDEMHKRTIRDALFIRFEADDGRGCIEILLDSQKGDVLDTKFIPPKKRAEAKPGEG